MNYEDIYALFITQYNRGDTPNPIGQQQNQMGSGTLFVQIKSLHFTTLLSNMLLFIIIILSKKNKKLLILTVPPLSLRCWDPSPPNYFLFFNIFCFLMFVVWVGLVLSGWHGSLLYHYTPLPFFSNYLTWKSHSLCCSIACQFSPPHPPICTP